MMFGFIYHKHGVALQCVFAMPLEPRLTFRRSLRLDRGAGDYGEPASAVNDAWSIGHRAGVKPVTVAGADTYVIPRPNSGYAGGFTGQGQNLNTVTIVTQSGTNKIITAFPGSGLPAPKP